MKLAVLTSTVSRNAGGLFYSVRYLHQSVSSDFHTQVYSFEDEYTKTDLSTWDNIPVKTFSFVVPSALKFSPEMNRELLNDKPDLIHVHGIWHGTSIASLAHKRNTGRPYLVSPRGMLDPWALSHSRWKKRLAYSLFEHSHLRRASCLHAVSHSEHNSMRAIGLKNPIALVPNGIDVPDLTADSKTKANTRKSLLFLGRIHPKKGLVNALKAWTAMNRKTTQEWQFVIAGWDQAGHLDELKDLCRDSKVPYSCPNLEDYLAEPNPSEEASVLFVGPAFGIQKDLLLRRASGFILPSFSEGMPMSVLEAWAYRLPVIMTEHCNIPEGFSANAAIRISTEAADISRGMAELMAATPEERDKMGSAGRFLVQERFTWPRIAEQMSSVYRWIHGSGDKPGCVIEH
jgi:glycosyltransferase involved in cell wall biosynthesis